MIATRPRRVNLQRRVLKLPYLLLSCAASATFVAESGCVIEVSGSIGLDLQYTVRCRSHLITADPPLSDRRPRIVG